MSIKLQCEHCGASITAPHEMAGQTSKCPACGNVLYVATPEAEIEELPLAPEDVSDLQKAQMLQAERRRLDSLLAHEVRAIESDPDDRVRGKAAPGSRTADAATAAASAGLGNRTEQAMHNYLAAMRDSDLDAAERAVVLLQLQPRTARELIERLASDQIPPPEMMNVPPGVYQKLLKNLRSRL
jgi:hypothetical protein